MKELISSSAVWWGDVMQKALKLETLKGFAPGHLATVGRRALGGSCDF